MTLALKPALAIKAPEVARVGQMVTAKVIEKHIGRPVPGAGVWAIIDLVNMSGLLTRSVTDYYTPNNLADCYPPVIWYEPLSM